MKLWNWLRESVTPLGYRMRRQVGIERFIVDFACLSRRVVIEIDGKQHGRDPCMRLADERRDRRLEALGYRILRFSNHDVDRRKSVVLDTIVAALD